MEEGAHIDLYDFSGSRATLTLCLGVLRSKGGVIAIRENTNMQ